MKMMKGVNFNMQECINDNRCVYDCVCNMRDGSVNRLQMYTFMLAWKGCVHVCLCVYNSQTGHAPIFFFCCIKSNEYLKQNIST